MFFKQQNIHKKKAKILSENAKNLNKNINIVDCDTFIDENSELTEFSDLFYESLDVIIVAVDNAEARLYLSYQ